MPLFHPRQSGLPIGDDMTLPPMPLKYEGNESSHLGIIFHDQNQGNPYVNRMRTRLRR